MKAAKFEYFRASDIAGAIRALTDAKGEAKVIAGAQSLGPMLNLRLTRPKLVVDVSHIDAIRSVESASGSIRIGGAVTHARIEDATTEVKGNAMLKRVAGDIAWRAVRNRGTVGGSLAHADPAADWPLALSALDAVAVIHGPHGQRSLPVAQFMLGAFTTVLADDEILESVVVPELSSAARWGYYKHCKRTGEFPEAAAAAVFDPERRTARIYAGAMSGAPRALPQLAAGVAQQGATALTASAVDRELANVAPDLDAVARKMHVGVVMRAVQQALNA